MLQCCCIADASFVELEITDVLPLADLTTRRKLTASHSRKSQRNRSCLVYVGSAVRLARSRVTAVRSEPAFVLVPVECAS